MMVFLVLMLASYLLWLMAGEIYFGTPTQLKRVELGFSWRLIRLDIYQPPSTFCLAALFAA